MPETLTVECPSGLVVTLREFKVSDEDLLADPKAQRKGAAISDLLNAILIRVDDPGLYQLKTDRRTDLPFLDWADVLQGDRMTVLLKNRIFTWGADLVFSQPCENRPTVCSPVKLEISLEDLPIKPLPESSRSHVTKGDPLFCVLPRCEKKVSFRLLRGADDLKLQKLQKQKADELSSSYLRFRTLDVEGVPANEVASFLRELGGSDASYLRAAFDEADCGVDQEVQFECGDCGHSWLDDVRFRSDFLFPKFRGRIGTPR